MGDIWRDSVFHPSLTYSTHQDALNAIEQLESSNFRASAELNYVLTHTNSC